MRALLLLLLTACSGVQGVPMAPRPPAFSPVLDAPITVGQPGYIGSPERAPRGIHTRVLPPTREAGVWAGDKPRASAAPPVVLDVLLPVAPSWDTKQRAVVSTCAALMDGMARRVIPAEALGGITANERSCLAARLWAFCAEEAVHADKKAREDGAFFDADSTAGHRTALAAAQAMVTAACKSPPTWEHETWLLQVRTKWREEVGFP